MNVIRLNKTPNLIRTVSIVAVVGGSVAAIASGASAALAPPTPPPTAVGHAQVVAQSAIELGDGPLQWAVGRETLNPGAPAVPAADVDNTFVLVLQGAAIAADVEEAPLVRLGAGEATFVGTAGSTTLAPADGGGLSLNRISLNAPGEGGTGDPFTPGPGVRDIDLLRDVLQPGETLAIADSTAGPALVVVTDGSVTVAGAPSGSADLAAGASGAFDGALTVVNGGTVPAALVVGIVGALVQTTPQAEVPTSAGPVGPTTPGTPTQPPGPTTPTAPDADGDGLSDAEESTAGTNPNDPDSDGDNLTDGEEVHTYGTDPLSSRTDDDHLEDGLEIERGTDPLDADTDDDGLMDSSDDLPLQGDGDHDADDLSFDQERDLGTDPANPDTDGDGDDDGYEVNNGTDPLVRNDGQPDPSTVDSDGDGFSDQDEIDAGSDPNDTDSTP